MSAWMVAKGHIDCLVQTAIVEGACRFEDADFLGRTLWDENRNSIRYRYESSDWETMLPEGFDTYRFEGVEAPLEPAIVLKQIECYQYQASEHPGWDDSLSRRMLDGLNRAICPRVAEGGSRGPWGIEHISEAVAA